MPARQRGHQIADPLIFITPVVTFYLLRDWDHLVARIDGCLPRQHADVIRAQGRLIDQTLAGYARGELPDYQMAAFLMAVFWRGLDRDETAALTDTPPVVPAKMGADLELGPACDQCGGMMQRTGSCYTCSSCGNNTGCG